MIGIMLHYWQSTNQMIASAKYEQHRIFIIRVALQPRPDLVPATHPAVMADADVVGAAEDCAMPHQRLGNAGTAHDIPGAGIEHAIRNLLALAVQRLT